MNAIDEVRARLANGRIQQAIDLLGRAVGQGDPEALQMLGEMALAGKYVMRDLSLSRELYGRAARAGSASAAAIYRAFVGNGTGGPADWAGAIRLLEDAAKTESHAAEELALVHAMSLDPDGLRGRHFETKPLSASPEVTLFPKLFTLQECDFLIRRSRPSLQTALVVDPQTGELVPNPVRTSLSMAYPLMTESPAIYALNCRLAAASGTSPSQGEPLQVLCYNSGQEYRPHFDAIAGADNQRILTFLVYLNDDFEGGETEFLSGGLQVKGTRGDGLLFRNADVVGRPDPMSKHAGLPVTSGEKYLASRWIRERPVLSA